MAKKKTKYYGGGLVPANSSATAGDVLGSTMSGMEMGNSFGPIGSMVGAFLGFAGAGLKDTLGDPVLEAQQKAQDIGGRMALDSSVQGNQYTPTFRCGGSVKRKMPHGGQVLPQQIVELEQGEPFRKPDGSMASIKNEDKLAHSEGGAKLPLEEGTQVLGNKKDPETKMKFKELGRKLVSQKNKYDKILEEKKGTYAENAAKAMISKTQKKWDAAFQRQGVDTPEQQFKNGGSVRKYYGGGGIEPWMTQSNWGQGTPTMLPEATVYGQSGQTGGIEDWMSTPFTIPQSSASSGPTGINMTKPQGNWGNWVDKQGGYGGLANTGLSLAGTAYNLIQGSRQAEQLNASDYYNPEYGNAIGLMANRRFNVDPMLEANRNASALGRYNLQNSGASAGQQYAGFQGLAANRMRADAAAYAQRQNMDNQYLAQEAQMRAGLGGQRAQTNLSIKDYNMRSDAARRNMLASGFGGLGEFGQMQQLMNNQKMTDQQRLEILKKWYPNFEQQFGDINFANLA